MNKTIKIYATVAWSIILIMGFYRAGNNAISAKCLNYCKAQEDVDFTVRLADSSKTDEQISEEFIQVYNCQNKCVDENLVDVSYLNIANFRYWMYP